MNTLPRAAKTSPWRNRLQCGSYNDRLRMRQSGQETTAADHTKLYLLIMRAPFFDDVMTLTHRCDRKYASGATLENNMQSAFDSFVYGVAQHDDHIVDVPDEITKMLYNFLSTMCFGKQ